MRRWDWYAVVVVLVLLFETIAGLFSSRVATQGDVAFIGLAVVFMLHD